METEYLIVKINIKSLPKGNIQDRVSNYILWSNATNLGFNTYKMDKEVLYQKISLYTDDYQVLGRDIDREMAWYSKY